MEITVDQLENLTRSLPAAERERLAERLFRSTHESELSEIDQAWIQVAEDRFAAYGRGEDTAIESAIFIDEIEDSLGWK